jgi:two-component system chemotaxis sensor kinase CheA
MTNEEIQAIYLQECEEGLASAESALMDIKAGVYDSETINTIFRAVHSIKGGAGAFGFTDLQVFTHHFETLLDKVRDGDVTVTPELIDLLMAAFDILADHVGAIRGDCATPDDAAMMQSLQEEAAKAAAPAPASVAAEEAPAMPDLGIDLGFDLAAMMAEISVATEELAPLDEDDIVAEASAAEQTDETAAAPSADAPWVVCFAPSAGDLQHGGEPLLLVRELCRLGGSVEYVDVLSLPSIDNFDADEAYIGWTIHVPRDVEEEKIREIFDFVADPASVKLSRLEDAAEDTAPEIPAEDLANKSIEDFAVEAMASFSNTQPEPEPEPPTPPTITPPTSPTPPAPQAANDTAPAAPSPVASKAAASATIRVDLEKLDRLVNLVGELVITQSMLQQRLLTAVEEEIQELSDLDHLTRELQDSAMAIRAQPVKSVFSRVPRIVRELEASTGKRINLIVEGEGTELDKTVIEKIGEPLTHLIRNCIDHGIESPEDRIAKGKPAEGMVRLAAEHKSGRIIISVSDDGAGINRDRVLAIAVERGIVSAEQRLTDEEIDNLIFAPGFSTAKVVSNISGRGVGMDVVRQSVQALGGRVTIQSHPGEGSIFTLALPLTLAISDGMIVSVGSETFVVPLTHVIESLRPEEDAVKTTGFGNDVLNVRGAYLPVIGVGPQLGVKNSVSDPTKAVLIIVDTEANGQAILMVDGIVDQRQVVIKSLETHYQQVEGVTGATILGDGRVALILDVEAVVALRAEPNQRLWA